ncbi:MAG: hypothetical protein J0L99_06595 [Chitinophagales bacterium]|nr:hypothetical protein [Chitinophagales bacterium]
MTPLAINLPRRYPGLKPFERAQSSIFHGRKDDIQVLANKIMRDRLVVLFAKSGIGKTSLLQAGVAPEIEREGYVSLFFRADDTSRSLTERFRETLLGNKQNAGYNQTDAGGAGAITLWEFMKRIEFDFNGLPATPVVVLDQFEEIFTLRHNEVGRNTFLHELADLANGSMPEGLRDTLTRRHENGQIDGDTLQWWETQPDVRIVIAIRSDFLHQLDDISTLIPGILRSRFQLQPLNRKQAAEAICAPAMESDNTFASPKFTYTDEAVQMILNFLAARTLDAGVQQAVEEVGVFKKNDEIESFNLQIICQYIEEKIIQSRQTDGFEVKSEFYEGKAGLEREIKEYYQNQINALPDTFKRKTGQDVQDAEALRQLARIMIEESLVTANGRRCSMVDDHLMANHPGVTQDFLDILVDTRLLRKENRLDDFYYEISHDTLLPAILESREKRRLLELSELEKAAYEQQLAEEAKRREAVEAELKISRERRRNARRALLASGIALFTTIVFFLWFGYNWHRNLRKELELTRKSLSIEQYEAAVEGFKSLKAENFKALILQQFTPYANVGAELDSALVLQAQYNNSILRNLIVGDSLFFNSNSDTAQIRNYSPALSAYRRAQDALVQYKKQNEAYFIATGKHRIRPQNISEMERTLEQRRRSAYLTLLDKIVLRQRRFEDFKEAGAWNLALYSLEQVVSLLPEYPDDQEKIKKDLKLSSESENVRAYYLGEIAICQRHL